MSTFKNQVLDTLQKGGSAMLAIPHAYAAILFSDSILLGLMLLCVTMLSPVVGGSGLVSLILAIVASRMLGFESWDSRSGITAFNSLVVGMAVGYYYPMVMIAHQPLFYLGFLGMVALFTLVLYILLSYLTNTYFRLPAMSLPFSLMAMLLWGYFARAGYLSNYPFDKLLLFSHAPDLPDFWRMFFVSMGSVFFTPEVWAGILVALALLIITRIGFVLAFLGWVISYYLMLLTGAHAGSGIFFPGFNSILIMYAIGGIYLLPGKTSWLIASFATAFGFLLVLLMNLTYHHYNPFTGHYTPLAVPVFAFPLNIVVLMVVFSLRLRIRISKPVMNDFGVFNPEQALQAYQERHKRFSSLGVPQFAMPLQGQWTITQGHNGSETHKLDWAYAWDFELHDASGKPFNDDAVSLNDYLAFAKPVYASAPGYVVAVLDGVVDNPIGQVNTRENWGNYLCLSHGYGIYSFYAHLKQGSVSTKLGDYLKLGDRIGLLGNSGRSARPHLHFQIQLGAEAGSKTRLSHLVNYKLHTVGNAISFIGSGIPQAGETISPLVPELHLQSIMGLQNLNIYNMQVKQGRRERKETWKVNLNLWGAFHLESSRGSSLEFSVYNGIYNALSLSGNRTSALSVFALLINRLPYAEKQELCISDEPALSVILHPVFRHLVLLLSPLAPVFKACTSSHIRATREEISVNSTIEYRILGIKFTGMHGTVQIDPINNRIRLSLYRKTKLIMEATGERE